MPMNHRLLVPQKLPLLLDYAGGAAAAFSLRQLSNSYVGPVVTVRRSTDSAERDFTATEVSDGTLAAWCGGGDGFVKTWWSQTGSNHASNSTAAQQPKIVSSGVVVTEGGKAAVQFDGTDDALSVPSSTNVFSFLHYSKSAVMFVAKPGYAAGNNLVGYLFSTGPKSVTGVANSAGVGVFYNDVSTNTDMIDVLIDNNSATAPVARQRVDGDFVTGYVAQYAIDFDPQNATSTSRIEIRKFGGSNQSVQLSQTYYSASQSASGTDAFIGQSGVGTAFFNGTVQELLIYPSDMTALRDRITADQMWYF